MVNELSEHRVFDNNLKGYREILLWACSGACFIMEATGVYHYKLACFIHSKGYPVSLVNPLSIKRFSQMLMRSTKTDKADAQVIQKYAMVNPPSLWTPPESYIETCIDLNGVLILMLKQRTALKNKLHSLESKGCNEKKVFKCIKQSIDNLNRQIERIEEQMEQLIEENELELFRQLKSIPGIGTKTAVFLIVITNGFRYFESSKH